MKKELVMGGLLVVLLLWVGLLVEPVITGQTYNETSLVNTTVNITNAAPLVTSITLDSNIDLVAYGNRSVYCNVSTTDFNNDSLQVNATLFLQGVTGPLSADDGNNHYTNSSCLSVTPQDIDMNWTCVFDVQYYADNSTNWYCNVSIVDENDFPINNVSNAATINPLTAIKMDELIDFGNMVTGEISNDTLANITNAGNRDVNITVEGYGDSPLDGLAMTCDYGQIPIEYEKYNVSANSSYTDMTQLTGSATQVGYGFYIPQRESESQESKNTTYWKLQVPAGASGVCSGKILFTAIDRG